MDSVRVAVRVRPFNQREIDMNAQLCISMNGRKTTITNPKPGERVDTTKCEDVKEFTYDYSYWSLDPQQPVFHSQEEIYQNLGSDVVDNAYDGYNACVFAYGQTGSGKTYTMMGTQAERGLIPRICYRLFDKMELSSDVRYRTEVSYLEIYNEQVKDLLQKQQSHSLRVREHPQTGPYVEQLSRHLVSSYSDISELIERGNTHRTTASTGMNDTSSRSHAIFTIGFTQAALVEGLPSERTSKIHLVDLAGSERAKATGATGCRLREGAHINKSLVTLGSVISALAEAGHRHTPGGRTPFVPYRDSTLTWLLKDSLGGNAKTVMIAAISPADVNYGETLSTLRYAHRAKSILNKPTVNEDRNVQLIRELRQEIARLRALIEGAGESPRALELIQEKEARADEMTNQWMEGWRETQKILQEQQTLGLRKSGVGVVLDSDRPHLIGIDDDLTSTGITLYQLKSERTTLGAAADCDIVLEGAGIADHHCVITLSDQLGGLLTAIGDAVCTVDQTDVEREHRLTQGCVITLGECSMFRYNSPAEAARLRRAGVRRASSRLSVLSLSACDLAATRSVESLLTAEKRLSWGSARELSRARQRSQPSLSRARLSVLGDPLLQTAPAGGLAAGPAPTDPIGEDDDPGGQTKELTNGAGAAERSCAVAERPPGQGSSPDLRTPGSLPESCTQTVPADSSSSVCRTCAAAGRRSPQADTASPALRAPGIALSPSTPSPPPASPSPLRVGGVPADSASLTSDSAPPPAGAETGDSEADSLESPIELGSDSELMGAFIEHEVQRRVTEQLAVQEQRLRAERAHQQLMNERQLARLHFTHQRQIRKLKSALNGVYSSVSTLPELGSEPLTIAEERAASTPRLNGSDSPPPASVVTVPRYVLRGAGRDAHFEYEIRLCAGGERYTLYRRFQRFRELHRYVAQRYGEQATAAVRLPPAKLFGRTSETLANERRGQLEEYLRRLLEKCSGLPSCPLHPGVTRRTLADFAPFFQRGVFEFTRAMTS
ncbi:kinesin-like protein Klp98A [Amphibalanus amphitrite]|uniref:kinesin-like protein Klp98A n=1 Tax=Amphibalanus amphitrite TaxID=1232801 RepID=UPI001C9058F8|nr:kinesin-like protein Klp98A [Amphibalanus amphitrite]